MNKKVLFIIFSIALGTGFFVCPKISLAEQSDSQFTQFQFSENLLLPEKEVMFLLNDIQKTLRENGILMFADAYFKPEEQAALITVRDFVKKKVIAYCLAEAPKEIVEKFVKATFKVARLISAPDIPTILDEFEKITVKEAVKYAEDYLLQNSIRTASGNLNFSYTSYNGNAQNSVFQYIICHRPLSGKYGEAGIEIYSTRFIETPKSTWENPCDFRGILSPFTIRITGKVEKTNLDEYIWDKDETKVEVIFSESVPEFHFSDSSFWENQARKVENEIKRKKLALEVLFEKLGGSRESAENFVGGVITSFKNTVGNVFNKLKSAFFSINPFNAGIVEVPSSAHTEQEIEPLEQQEIKLLKEKVKELEQELELSKAEVPEFEEVEKNNISQEQQDKAFKELVEKLNKISEEMDRIGEEITELSQKQASQASESDESEGEQEEEEAAQDIEKEQDEQEKELQELSTASQEILISEVCAGLDKAQNEFIELYNPNDYSISLNDENFNLKLVNSSNKVTKKKITWVKNIIPAHKYFLLSGGELMIDSQLVQADATYSSQLSGTSGVIITDGLDNILDKIAWGKEDKLPLSAVETKGKILEAGLKTGESLERINTGNKLQDTDNNFQDFNLNNYPSPTNSSGQKKVYYSSYSLGGGSSSSSGGSSSENSSNNSSPEEYSPLPEVSEILISEAKTNGDEWIELYNPTTTDISLNGCYLSYFSSSKDWNEPSRNWQFPQEAKILGKDYFLISVYSPSSTENFQNKIDWELKTQSGTPYSQGQLANSSGAVAIFSFDPSAKSTSEQAETGKIDALGWGETIVKEGESIASLTSDSESFGRKWATDTQDYIDSDNNQNDFETQEPTPSLRNITTINTEPESPNNQSPSAHFIFSPENPAVNQEIIFNSSSTDPDGEITSFVWDFGDSNSTTTDQTTTTHYYSASGNYEVELIVFDNDGATSFCTTTLTITEEENEDEEIVFAQGVIISEVKASGDEEFIELYNPTENDINISDWYFSYFSSKRDWNDPYLNKSFSESKNISIPAKDYYLISFGDYPDENTDSQVDWKPYKTNLNNKDGTVGIFSCNPKIATSTTTTLAEAVEQAKNCKIDVLGWGEAIVKEEIAAAIPSSSNESLARKIGVTPEGYLNYIDSDNNQNDFAIQEPTPKAENRHSYSDLDQDGIIDAYDPETIVSVDAELKPGERIFKDLIITNEAKLTLNSDSSLGEGFKGVKIEAENLIVNSGSSLSANEKGYPAGEGFGAGNSQTGGGYGGNGANCGSNKGGSSYGDLFQPISLGSGGGSPSPVQGGAGGGAIIINVAGTLTINGNISANGGNGMKPSPYWPASGGGSGGSVYITTNTLTGSGLITANGGESKAGGGAGGRIAVYYESNDFDGLIEAFGKNGGGAGTVFIKSSGQEFGDLTINNNNCLGNFTRLENNLIFNKLQILNSARLYLSENLTAANIEVKNNSFLESQSAATITAVNQFNIDLDSSLIILPEIFLTLNASDLLVQQNSSLLGNFNINANSFILDAASSISADNKGYLSQEGPGQGSSGSGAGYGGQGENYGSAKGGSSYGDILQPIDLGSGGGNVDPVQGGAGGGAIIINISGALTIHGSISANGGNGMKPSPYWPASGGGSGGSVYITTNTLTGSGSITANGGESKAGGGAGGRIAVYYESSDFDGLIEALGKTNGSDGTIIYE